MPNWFKQCCDYLDSQYNDSEEEESDTEEENTSHVSSAFQHLIKDDEDRLMEILSELKKDEVIDAVLELEALIELFLEKEFVDGAQVAPKIHRLLETKLDNKILKSYNAEIKLIVGNIEDERERLRQISNRVDRATDPSVFNQLARERLISSKQYEKLMEAVEDLDMKGVLDIVKHVKLRDVR